jgi:dCTP deaminase
VSVLVDETILAAMDRGAIVIRPFDRCCLGTNSYDVHLAPTLRVYKDGKVNVPIFGGGSEAIDLLGPLDVRVPRETVDVPIPEEGIVLEPGELYLASTTEYTESNEHVPMLNGRSSLGRYGLSIHVTAGTGDVGFRGHWTMELFVIKPLRVYAGIAVGQLLWLETSGAPLRLYGGKASAKYNDTGPLPQPSKLHEELGAPHEED